jgi:hypothetical protein
LPFSYNFWLFLNLHFHDIVSTAAYEVGLFQLHWSHD